MTIEQLRTRLAELLTGDYDPEKGHSEADQLLLEYINDPEVTEIFNKSERWYA